MKWIEIDISEEIVRVDDITEGDLNSAGIRVFNFPENWKDKLVDAVFYRGTDSIDVRLKLNGDKDRLIGNVPTQMLAEDGSFKIVIYAVATNQVEEPYRDVRPAVWAEVRDGLESAEVLPLDKDVGAYLTLLIDLQNKETSIDEMIARLGDIEAIKTKLEGVADGAEVNVQSDWSEEDENSDAYVKNKPTIDQSLNGGSSNAVANSAVAAKFEELGNVVEQMGKDLSGAKQEIEKGAEVIEGTSKDLIAHKSNEYADEQHLTSREKENIQYIADNVDAIIEDIERVDESIGDVRALYAEEVKRLDRVSDDVIATDKRVDVLEAIPKTKVPTTLEVNTAYNFGSQNAALTLTFPSIANDGDVIYIGFVCREGLNLVVDTTNTYDFDLIPEKDTGYEIYAKCTTNLGVLRWIVKYSEYSGVGE